MAIELENFVPVGMAQRGFFDEVLGARVGLGFEEQAVILRTSDCTP
ncbi:hypothetical protein [Acidovorax sp. A1169]|nr:hypothetical protein [Acidovorax sp. A1169]MDP4078857.1 hypothetical protein [Acidovorax sp. A1169]